MLVGTRSDRWVENASNLTQTEYFLPCASGPATHLFVTRFAKLLAGILS